MFRVKKHGPVETILLAISIAYVLQGSLRSVYGQKLSNPQLPRNISEEAYNQVRVSVSDDDGGDLLPGITSDLDVLRNGIVQPLWLPIPMQNQSGNLPLRYHTSGFTDRLTFDFTYGGFSIYDFSKPIATSSNERISSPKIIHYNLDDSDNTGTFTVIYDCQGSNTADVGGNVSISIVFPIVSSLSLYFSHTHVCVSGHHPHISFGYYPPATTRNDHQERQIFKSSRWLTIAPHVASTRIFIHLNPPGRSQEFFHVTTNSSSSSLSTHARGPVFGSVLHSSETAIVHVLYECFATGIYNVSIWIPIPPFTALSATWSKNCGGGAATGLNVGRVRGGNADVVRDAVTEKGWGAGVDEIRNRDDMIIVNSSTRGMEFWVWKTGEEVEVGGVIVTVGRQDVLYGWSKGLDEGKIIGNGAGERRIWVGFVCKKKGKSVIVITVGVRGYGKVEWGFVKVCKKPKRWIKGGVLRTAGSVSWIASAIVGLGMGAWWVWMMGRGIEKQRRREGLRGRRGFEIGK